MPIKHLDSQKLDLNEDWEGNNAAFTCPHCRKVFIVSGTRMHNGERKCPNCEKSIGRISMKGGRKSGGQSSLEW